MVGLPPRDNGKTLFSITVVTDADIGASAGGGGGSQRAVTCALGCGALAAAGTSSGIGASDAGVVEKVVVVIGGGQIGSIGASANAGRGSWRGLLFAMAGAARLSAGSL